MPDPRKHRPRKLEPAVASVLPRSFYERPVVQVARALLGQMLVRVLPDGTRLAGIIVETEAYLGVADLAAHTVGGRRTQRNASMWKAGGHAYVYFTYGMHYCMNAVAGLAEQPVAVLLRALEPVEGLEVMRRQRHLRDDQAMRLICCGPARLCQALGIDRNLDGADLCTGPSLFIEQLRRTACPGKQIVIRPRVGVAYAGEWAQKPLRFYLRDNPHISRP